MTHASRRSSSSDSSSTNDTRLFLLHSLPRASLICCLSLSVRSHTRHIFSLPCLLHRATSEAGRSIYRVHDSMASIRSPPPVRAHAASSPSLPDSAAQPADHHQPHEQFSRATSIADGAMRRPAPSRTRTVLDPALARNQSVPSLQARPTPSPSPLSPRGGAAAAATASPSPLSPRQQRPAPPSSGTALSPLSPRQDMPLSPRLAPIQAPETSDEIGRAHV